MPLVFVHGVSNRWSEDYRRGVHTRDALFQRFLVSSFAPRMAGAAAMTIRNPYWGDHGARLHWRGASLPLETFESLGSEDATFVALQAAADPEGAVNRPAQALLTVARRSLPEAVDLLWSAAALSESGEAEALAELAAAACVLASREPSPAWLAEVRDDEEFLVRLQRELRDTQSVGQPLAPTDPTKYESLGLEDGWNALRHGASRLRVAATTLVGRSASDRIRPAAIPSIANFLGDVFLYLHEQEAVARPIGELVEAAFRAAADERADGDPLIVVAHSMGGIISYDLLTSTASDVPVDLLVTVGSQVGFFEELKLFKVSDRSIPGDDMRRKVPAPRSVRHWINIFDYSDLLGFAVGSIIDGVSDYAYGTGSLLKVHGTYFLQPGFHQRLALRAAELGT